MTERHRLLRARCESCDVAYRVSNPDREYECKACGGVVRVDDASGSDDGEDDHGAESHLFDDLVTCEGCEAVNHSGAHFCAECGAVLPTGRPRHARDDGSEERHKTTRALKEGYRWLFGVTWLFRIGALAYAAVTVIAVIALASTDVPEAQGLAVVAVMSSLTVAMLAGVLLIPFKPFLWTVFVAVLATLATATHVVGPNPLGLAALGSAAWAVLLWAAVVPTLRMQRLIQQHTDEYILHHASLMTRRELKGRTPKARHERLLNAMHRAAGRAWKLTALAGFTVAMASAFGAYTVLTRLRPQDFSVVRQDFEQAWNRSDIAAIGALFPEEIREQRTTWLGGITGGRGWGDALPALPPGERREDGLVWIDYPLEDLTVSAGWARRGLEWFLFDLDIPRPALQETLDRFEAAWDSSDPQAMAAFFPESHVGAYRQNIETAAEKREWTTFPEILGVDVDESLEEETKVTFRIPYGEVATRWRFRSDGTWGMQSCKFPALRAYRKARDRAIGTSD